MRHREQFVVIGIRVGVRVGRAAISELHRRAVAHAVERVGRAVGAAGTLLREVPEP